MEKFILIGFTCKCWGNWRTSYLGLSHSPWNGHGSQETCVRTGRKQMSQVFKKGKKEDPRNYRPVSLTWVLEWLILEAISMNAEYKKLIRSSQHGFTKRKLCLTNLISFYNGTTAWRHEGRALDFRKGFDAISHYTLIDKHREWGLDKWMLSWM